MGRHAAEPVPATREPTRHSWRDRAILAACVAVPSWIGVVWAGGGWRLGVLVAVGAAAVVVLALTLAATIPGRSERSGT